MNRLIKKKLGRKPFELLQLFEANPKYAFNIKEIVKKGFGNAYYNLRELIDVGLIVRIWNKNKYEYCLKSELED